MDNQTLNIKPKNGYGFVYCYISPSGKRYIGKTKTTLKTRAQHNTRGYKGCTAFYNAIQKYGFQNFSVEILQEVPIEVLTLVETQYIIDYDTTNPKKGYNIITDYHNFLSTLNRIPIYCYDGISGKFLKRYDSIAQAQRQMNVYRGSIQRIVNCKDHRVKNCVWLTEYFEQIQIEKNNLQPNSKEIFEYDCKTGNYLRSFSSIRQAARETGYDRKTISDQVANKSKKHSKYLFSSLKVDNIYDGSSTTIPCGVDSSESKQR